MPDPVPPQSGRSSSSGDGPRARVPFLVPLGKHQGKPAVAMQRPVFVVGARHNAHLHLLSRSVSKAHCVLIQTAGGVYVRDLCSRTKTLVNGRPVREADLKDRDQLTIGSFLFKYSDKVARPASARAARAPAAQLVVEGAEAPVGVGGRVVLIGRRPECDVSLVEESVSTAHAILFDRDGQWYVRDLGSRTGTFVNGTKVHQEQLNFGDALRIGETDLRLEPATDAAVRPAADGALDELEDLIGTAPLIGDELQRATAADASAERAAPAPPKDPDAIPLTDDDDDLAPQTAAKGKPAAEDDLDALGLASDAELDALPLADEPVASRAAPAAPVELGASDPAADDEPQRDAIDLSSDPDVAGGPADTRRIALPPPEDTQRRPTISPDVVDEPEPAPAPARAATAPPADQRMMVDVDLNAPVGADRMSNSATAADLQDDAEEAIARSEAGDDDVLAVDAPAPKKKKPKADDPGASRWGWRRKAADPAAPAAAPPTKPPADLEELDKAVAAAMDVDLRFDDDGSAAAAAPPPPEKPAKPAKPVAPPPPPAEPVMDDLDLSALSIARPQPEAEPDVEAWDEAVPPVAERPLVPPEPPAAAAEDEAAAPILLEPDVPGAQPSAADAPDAPVEPLVTGDAGAAAPVAPVESDATAPVAEPETGTKGKRKRAAPAKAAKPPAAPKAPRKPRGKKAVAPPPPAVAPTVEIIETTEPTPESALDAGDLPGAATADEAPPVVAESLSDTALGREVSTLGGDIADPIVVEPHAPVSHAARGDDDDLLLSPDDAPRDADGDRHVVTPVEVVEAEPQAEIVDGADIDVVAELPSQPELADADRIEPLELELADTLPAAEVEAPAEAKFKFDLDDLIEPPAPTAPALPKLVEPVPEPEPVELDETKLLQPAAEDGVDEAPEPIELPELELAEPEPEAEVEPTVEVGPAAEAELEVEPESEPHSELEPEPAAAALTAPAESDLLDFPADEVEPDAEPEAEPVAMDAEPEPAPAPVAPPPPAARRSGTMAYEAPDESDMLVPADDDDGASVGRDQQSFLGGMPLPLPQAPGLPDDGRDGPMSPAATTAAPRPAALPPPAAPPRSKVPPRPPAQRSYTPFAGTPFEVSADELPIPENQQPYVPPFAGGGKAGRKAMGFDGLAMPPVRQVDVFSQATGPAPTIPRAGQPTPPPVEPEPAGDVIDEDDAPDFGDGDAPIAPALTNLGNRAAPPKPPVAGFRPPAPAPADPNRPPVKKRRRFGVRWLLPVVLLGMLGTGAGIWLFVSPQTQVEGRIVYDGLPELMRNDPAKAKRLQAEQAALALDAGTLSRATASLQRDFRVKAPGFLGNAVDLEKNVRVEWWPRDKPVRMVLHRTSTSPNDRERMRAWVEAIVAATGTLKDGKARLEAERDATERARRDAQERVSFLQGRIQQATGAFEAAPSRDERQRLAGAVETAKATVGDAQRELTVARDALNKLQADAVAAGGVGDARAVPQVVDRYTEAVMARENARAAAAFRAGKAAEAAAAAAAAFDERASAATGDAATAAGQFRAAAAEVGQAVAAVQRRQAESVVPTLRGLAERRDARAAQSAVTDPAVGEIDAALTKARAELDAATARGDADTDLTRQRAEVEKLDDQRRRRLAELAAAGPTDAAESRAAGDSLAAAQRDAADAARQLADRVQPLLAPLAGDVAAAGRAWAEAIKRHVDAVDAVAVAETSADAQRLAAQVSDLAGRVEAARAAEAAAADRAVAADADRQAALRDARQRVEVAAATAQAADDAYYAALRKLNTADRVAAAVGYGTDTLFKERQELSKAKEDANRLAEELVAKAAAARDAVVARVEGDDAVVVTPITDQRPLYLGAAALGWALVLVGGSMAGGRDERRRDGDDDDDAVPAAKRVDGGAAPAPPLAKVRPTPQPKATGEHPAQQPPAEPVGA